MSRAAQAVLFDLDGTLVETAPEIRDAVNATLRSLGLPEAPLAQVEAWIGHGTGTLLARALAHASGVPHAQVRASALWRVAEPRFVSEYGERCGSNSRPYPQARELLEALRERRVHTAVVTNKEQRFAERVLQCHGLDAWLDRLVGGDLLPSRKPDPAGVHLCLRGFGVGPAQALFVGDSSIDVATARNAGLRVWAVDHGYNLGEPIASAQPDRVLSGLQQVLEAVAVPAQDRSVAPDLDLTVSPHP
jgi:phosphoglycolate phosphatase